MTIMNNQNQTVSTPVWILVPMLLLVVVVIPFMPLFISGRWDWVEAWIYAIVFILGFIVSRLLAAQRHPDLLAERARFMQHEDAKTWDNVLAPLVAIGSGFIPLVAGLDERLHLSPPYSVGVKIVSLVMILAGYALGTYALVENRYFSGIVRIQTERSHHVVSSGPYRWIRHPGYAGALLSFLATPFFLDATWALLPAFIVTIFTVIRTHLEDKTLQAELEGYRGYSKRVKYRLLPGIW